MEYNDTAIDEWLTKYQPIDNPISNTSGWDGKMFETYGEELSFVLRQNPKNVWTWWDTEAGSEIIAGYHLVNRIGYFITKKEWEDELQSIDIEIKEEDDE